MKPFFTEDDFMYGYSHPAAKHASKVANEKLNEYLVTCPKVYGANRSQGWNMGQNNDVGDTHTAILFGIEEIKPKECAHIGQSLVDTYGMPVGYVCRQCDAKLKPPTKWERE